MPPIIFWNCRGARKRATSTYLRHLIGVHSPIFIALLETRVDNFTRKEIDILAGRGWDFFCKPSQGKSGGIITLWRREVTKFNIMESKDQVVIGQLAFDHSSWLIAAVYANKDYVIRREVWQTIAAHCSMDSALIVGGDFNCIRSQLDKRGGKPFRWTDAVEELEDFMLSCDLHELEFSGPRFTWTNNKSGLSKIWVRLDRILINSLASSTIGDAKVAHLARIASDHCPIALPLGDLNPRPACDWLRFEDTWLSYPMTWRIVHDSWGNLMLELGRKCLIGNAQEPFANSSIGAVIS